MSVYQWFQEGISHRQLMRQEKISAE